MAPIVSRLEDIMKQLSELHPEEFKTIFTDTGIKVRIF